MMKVQQRLDLQAPSKPNPDVEMHIQDSHHQPQLRPSLHASSSSILPDILSVEGRTRFWRVSVLSLNKSMLVTRLNDLTAEEQSSYRLVSGRSEHASEVDR